MKKLKNLILNGMLGISALGIGYAGVIFKSAVNEKGLYPYSQVEVNETVQFNPITPEQEEMISRLVVSRDGLYPYSQTEVNETVQYLKD